MYAQVMDAHKKCHALMSAKSCTASCNLDLASPLTVGSTLIRHSVHSHVGSPVPMVQISVVGMYWGLVLDVYDIMTNLILW